MNTTSHIYILRSNDLCPDPRVDKYIHFFQKEKIAYRLVGWNRNHVQLKKEHTDYYNHHASYGSGMKNLWNLICWNIFLIKYLYKKRKTIKIIHACDFDTIIPALLLKLFTKTTVFFDIFDWYSDSRDINNRIIKKFIKQLEHLAVKYSDYIIICESERRVQIGKVQPDKVLVMQNIPDFPNIFKHRDDIAKQNLSISYVGILSRHRGLEVLLKTITEFPHIILNIAGFGELEELVVKYEKKYANIHFIGKVPYDQGLSILASSDCIYAMYYTNIKNHIFAAPNKFYESLYLGKPLITTEGTLVGDKVLKYNSGFVIQEGETPLIRLLNDLNPAICSQVGKNAKKYWEEIFSNRIDNFFKYEYGPLVYATFTK